MSFEEDCVRLMDHFQHLGCHVERRVVGGSDTIVVAARPDIVSGVTVYQQSVQIHQSRGGQWHTMVVGVTLPWVQSLESPRGFVSDLMESEDAYVTEGQRRLRSVGSGA
jgi:hypothetical protein